MNGHIAQSNTFTLKGGKSLAFPFPVAEVIDYPSVAVVRLDVPPGSRFNENVFAVDHGANIVWQVPKKDYVYDDSPYTALEREGDNVVLYNWDGLELTVEALSGKVVKEVHRK